MGSLPSDILLDIVSRVPSETVLDCKLVCKHWETLIHCSENNLANMHLSRQLNHMYGNDDGSDNIASAKVDLGLFFACRIEDPDKFISLLFHGGKISDRISIDKKYIYNQNLKRIYHPPMHNDNSTEHLVGSCNGLVCALQHHHTIMDPIYICNPLTREYVHLPELVVKEEDVFPDLIRGGEIYMFRRTGCGFGYVWSTNEYKVVRIYYLDRLCMEGNVEVYTLGSGCGWRATGKVPYELLGISSAGKGTYANDAIYWTSYHNVFAFDLADEEFRLLSVPSCMQNREPKDMFGLVALGRHLYFYMDKKLQGRMEIWSLMKSSDSEETWCMEFDIDYKAVLGYFEQRFPPILLTMDREIIFLYSRSVLYCYDTKKGILKKISNKASTDHLEVVEPIAHVNTFASLEAIGEKSRRYTVRIPLDVVIKDLDGVSLGEKIDTTRFRLR